MARIVGPVHRCQMDDGTSVPLYVLAFDKGGVCTTPRSRDVLYDELQAGGATDVIVASHGWNTTPKGAVETYTRWMARYASSASGWATSGPRQPVVVGVVWPSTWLVPLWERGPKIAAAPGGPGTAPEDVDPDDAIPLLAGSLAEGLEEDARARVHELVDRDDLSEESARELAGLFAGHLGSPQDVEDLLDAWRALAGSQAPPVVDDPDAPLRPRDPGVAGGGPEVAGRVGRAPVDLLRVLSVWQMKDRAGLVGARGVADTLRGILAAGGDTIRVHAVGHSYGCKVVLSAIDSPRWAPLPAGRIESLLLIQPAVNGYAFAESIPEAGGQPGGHHAVPTAVRQPILATFTSKDLPLRQAFHLGLRRASDLTEAQIAGDDPPSEFAALGGYGPRGLSGSAVIDMPAPGEAYPSTVVDVPAVAVLGLRAHNRISGHGDHDNAATHWALHTLIEGMA